MSTRGALCQVQNVTVRESQNEEDLKPTKTTNDTRTRAISDHASAESVSDNPASKKLRVKDGNEGGETKIQRQDVEKNIDKKCDVQKIDESKVQKAEVVPELSMFAEVAVQTDVSVSGLIAKVTAEDLRAPEVSENYWRRYAERLHTVLGRELRENFELSVRHAKLMEKISKLEEEVELLRDYIASEEGSSGSGSDGDTLEEDENNDDYIIPL